MMTLASVKAAQRAFNVADWGNANDHAVRFASSPMTLAMIEKARQYQAAPTPSTHAIAFRDHEGSVEEKLFEALANVKIYTSQVAMQMEREWRDKLFMQLDSLLDPVEWCDGMQPLRRESFATFLKLMFVFRPAKRPGLGISSTGNLMSFWKNDSDRLTIESMGSDMVRWVLTIEEEHVTRRLAGDDLVSNISNVLKPYNTDRWFKNGIAQST